MDHQYHLISTFELWCSRRLLRVPWTAGTSNQSILKQINPEYSLEGLMLKLKLQHFGHLVRRADLLQKTLMLRKIEGRRRRGWQGMRWLDGITKSVDMNLGKLWKRVKDREARQAALHGVIKSCTQLSDWATTRHRAFLVLDLWCWTNWYLSSKRLKSRNLVGGSKLYTIHTIQPALAEGCPELTDERLVKQLNVSCPGCVIYTVAG